MRTQLKDRIEETVFDSSSVPNDATIPIDRTGLIFALPLPICLRFVGDARKKLILDETDAVKDDRSALESSFIGKGFQLGSCDGIIEFKPDHGFSAREHHGAALDLIDSAWNRQIVQAQAVVCSVNDQIRDSRGDHRFDERTQVIKEVGHSFTAFEWPGKVLASDGLDARESCFFEKVRQLLF